MTITFGLDLFDGKLTEVSKLAKEKFATGRSVTTSPDARNFIDTLGNQQNDFHELVHTVFDESVTRLRSPVELLIRFARRMYHRLMRARAILTPLSLRRNVNNGPVH